MRDKKRQSPVPVAGKPFMVVGGMRLEITGVEFRDGRIIVIAKGMGPTAGVSGYATIFGSDGQGICQIDRDILIPPLRSCDPVTVTQPIIIDTLTVTGGPDAIYDFR